MRSLFYMAVGYLAGSVLFARLWTHLLGGEEVLLATEDGNPGTSNAFACGGFACGLLTLAGDLLKGALPVFFFVRGAVGWPEGLSLVLAAPVLGHAFPIFYHFRGGKGIAVTFGCLLGLLPYWKPAAILAGAFLFFSLVVKIGPHFQRTAVTYVCAALAMVLLPLRRGVTCGFLLAACVVCLRLHLSRETREEMSVELPWIS